MTLKFFIILLGAVCQTVFAIVVGSLVLCALIIRPVGVKSLYTSTMRTLYRKITNFSVCGIYAFIGPLRVLTKPIKLPITHLCCLYHIDNLFPISPLPPSPQHDTADGPKRQVTELLLPPTPAPTLVSRPC